MKIRVKVVIFILFLLLIILCSACSPTEEKSAVVPTEKIKEDSTEVQQPSATPEPSPTAKSTTLDFLQSLEPDFEVFFDGEDCVVEGPSEISLGEYLVVVYNETEINTQGWMANYHKEGSFDDHLLWREENCGGQGTHCEDENGVGISYNLVSWMFPTKQARDGAESHYTLWEVKQTREHSIVVTDDREFEWLCSAIQVNK